MKRGKEKRKRNQKLYHAHCGVMTGTNEKTTQQFTIRIFSGIIDCHLGSSVMLLIPSLKNIT
jgi:hypothetical protein